MFSETKRCTLGREHTFCTHTHLTSYHTHPNTHTLSLSLLCVWACFKQTFSSMRSSRYVSTIMCAPPVCLKANAQGISSCSAKAQHPTRTTQRKRHRERERDTHTHTERARERHAHTHTHTQNARAELRTRQSECAAPQRTAWQRLVRHWAG